MVIPDEGKLKWLYWALCTDGSDLENFTLKLFKNDYTPDDDSTGSSVTVADLTRYAHVTINRSLMPSPSITSHAAYSTRSTAPSVSSTGGSSQTVYGGAPVGAIGC